MSAPGANGSAAGQKQQGKNGKQLDGARKQTASPAAGDSSKKQQSQPPAQKAWQGSNPTIRGTSSSSTTPTANGTDKASPKPARLSQAQCNNSRRNPDAHTYLLTTYVGQDVTLKMQNGEQFTGVFSGASLQNPAKQTFTLKMVKKTRPATDQQINGHTELASQYIGEGDDHAMVFNVQDTAGLKGEKPSKRQPAAATNGAAADTFRTDTEISGRERSIQRPKELQRWDAGEKSGVDMSLESGGSGGWDQFAVNERMYGVQDTYDENMYTTTIDRNNPRFKEREAKAERIAREIEGSSSANAHVAEERRRDADKGDGLDEEEKYSGVHREASQLPKRGTGSYVPPSQRPISNAPGARGAPYDPAIISSALARPAVEKPAEVPKPAAEEQPQEVAATAETSSAAPPSQAPTAQNPAKPTETTQTPEDHIRATTDAFKQFANIEKLRVKQSQEHKRIAQRHEKAVKLNDLKKFAANFKLKSRVPDDLVPILAKDHEKQQQIQKRADEAANEEAVRSTERVRQKSLQDSSAAASPSTKKEPTMPDQTVDRNAAALSHRARVSQNLRGPMIGGQPLGRGMGGGRGMQSFGRPPPPQPLENIRMPGPPMPPMPATQNAGPLSPGAAKRLNVNAKAFEFRPGASTFTPTGASPSPQRDASTSKKPVNRSFFAKKPRKDANGDLHATFEPLNDAVNSTEFTEGQKKDIALNGGAPQPYRTPPTWGHTEKNVNASYKDGVPRQPRMHSQGSTPMQTPGPNMGGPIPHSHQLPPQLQAPSVAAPSQRPHQPPQYHGPYPPHFDPRMGGPQMYAPNGNLQGSPRFPPAQVAYGGPQMHPMGMPQFGGQGQGMQGYAMSPNLQYRQLSMPPPNGPQMVMGPNGPQHPHMPPMPAQPYPNRGPPQPYNPHMQMQPQPPFMNGPPHQNVAYSPMPHPAQPHMMNGPAPGPPYNASPRHGGGAPMMQHSSSHQGYGGGHPGFAPPMQGQGGQHHPVPMQQRQYSHGGNAGVEAPPIYRGGVQVTPRMGAAMPHLGGQGMGQGQGQVSPRRNGGPGEEGR